MSTQTFDVTVTKSTISEVVEEETETPLKRHAVWKWDNGHMAQFFAKEDWANADAARIIDIARIRKIAINARCGHNWVPQMTNPTGLETCDECISIMSNQKYED